MDLDGWLKLRKIELETPKREFGLAKYNLFGVYASEWKVTEETKNGEKKSGWVCKPFIDKVCKKDIIWLIKAGLEKIKIEEKIARATDKKRRSHYLSIRRAEYKEALQFLKSKSKDSDSLKRIFDRLTNQALIDSKKGARIRFTRNKEQILGSDHYEKEYKDRRIKLERERFKAERRADDEQIAKVKRLIDLLTKRQS